MLQMFGGHVVGGKFWGKQHCPSPGDCKGLRRMESWSRGFENRLDGEDVWQDWIGIVLILLSFQTSSLINESIGGT
jgi:hypothetical protein